VRQLLNVLGNHRSNNEVVSLGLIFLLIVGSWTFDWGSEFRPPRLHHSIAVFSIIYEKINVRVQASTC